MRLLLLLLLLRIRDIRDIEDAVDIFVICWKFNVKYALDVLLSELRMHRRAVVNVLDRGTGVSLIIHHQGQWFLSRPGWRW